MDNNLLKILLIRHEGMRYKPYRDTVGNISIGIGRNLDGIGISDDEIDLMLHNDIGRATNAAIDIFSDFDTYSDKRQMALISLLFMGTGHFLTFKKMIQAIKNKDWKKASKELLDSKYADQVGYRAKECAEMLKKG